MSPDWAKIKREYIRGGTSYAKLAKKYGLSEKAVNNKGREENWRGLREEKCRKSAAKTVEKLADQESETNSRLHKAAMMLMDAFEKSITMGLADGGILAPELLKEYATSLRNIQQVATSMPTQRDIDEQLARIAKLRGEAKQFEEPEQAEDSGFMKALSDRAGEIQLEDDSSMLPIPEEGDQQ